MGFIQRNFLTSIFIIIEREEKFCFVHVYKVKHNKVIKKQKNKFFYEKKTNTPGIMLDYIYSFTRKYSSSYISMLLDSSLQQIMIEKEIDKKFLKTLNEKNISIFMEKKWRIYCNIHDLSLLKQDYQSIRIDFVFSPLAMLYYLYKTYNRGTKGLYVLATKSLISMIVFKDGIAVKSMNISLLHTGEEDYDNNLDNLDELEDDFDMEVDEGLELDLEISTEDDIEGDTQEESSNDATDLITQFTSGMSEIINSFYDSKHYTGDSDFIDKLIIFNLGFLDKELKHSIKEHMLLDIFTKDLNFADIMSDMNRQMIWR
jgi:hypothetical protein